MKPVYDLLRTLNGITKIFDIKPCTANWHTIPPRLTLSTKRSYEVFFEHQNTGLKVFIGILLKRLYL